MKSTAGFKKDLFVRRQLKLLVMKLSLMMMMAVALNLSANAHAQNVTLKIKNEKVLKILQAIEKRTDYTFLFHVGDIDLDRRITVEFKQATIYEVLSKMFYNEAVEFEVTDKVIVLRKSKFDKEYLSPLVKGFQKEELISGQVKDENGKPIEGVTVTIRGTLIQTFTDKNGYFTLEGNGKSKTLRFSHIGYSDKEIVVKENGVFTVILELQVKSLDEAVVVAYGTSTQRSNVAAVTVIKGADISSQPNRSFDRSLQGLVAGLNVTSGNGQPGGGTSNLVLRGIGTAGSAEFGSNVRDPLVVIDGIPISNQTPLIIQGTNTQSTAVTNPFAQINPSDIASVTILRDAAAIALYGSRASNGVIIITTKKGKGLPRVTFSQQFDISRPLNNKIDILNSNEYLNFVREAYKNSDSTIWNDNSINDYLYSQFPIMVSSQGDTMFYQSPDWYSKVFLEKALTSTTDLTFSGGNDRKSFYFSVNYVNQEGVVRNTGFERASIRYNTTNILGNRFTLNFNTSITYSKQKLASVTEGAGQNIGVLYSLSPLLPNTNASGNYIYSYPYGTVYSVYGVEIGNPIASLEKNINYINAYRGLGSLNVEVKLFKNINYIGTAGLDFMFSQWKEKTDKNLPRPFELPIGEGYIGDENRTRIGYNLTNLFQYQSIINKTHDIKVLFGHEIRGSNDRFLFGSGSNLQFYYATEVSNTIGNQQISGNLIKTRLLSYFSQINYGYKGKYYAQLSARADASSQFGADAGYRGYWSAGIGYVVSDEKFFHLPFVNFLRVRGSVGTSGNSTILSSVLRYDRVYLGSYLNQPAVIADQIANKTIEPEKPFNLNVGLDFRLINNRIEASVDVYRRVIKQLLYPVQVPNSSGATGGVLDNIGDMENKGLEISLLVRVIQNARFKWDINANWSTNRNQLTKAAVEKEQATGLLINQVGKPFNSFYLPVWVGVNPADGKPLWIDSMGKNSSDYYAAKKEAVGSTQPKGFGGIINTVRYKNLEMSVFVYYSYGAKAFDNARQTLLNDGSIPLINQARESIDRWRKPGDMAKNPRISYLNGDNGSQISTRYLFSTDFIRLKNISIGYNIESKFLQLKGVKSMKLYVQASNIATWTDFPGVDPENSSSQGVADFSYPQAQSFSLGLNINF